MIKPIYTVKDFQYILGYKTIKGAREFLIKVNVPLHLIGSKYIIYLSEIQTYAPELYASILESNNLNVLLNKQDTGDDEFLSQQLTK